MIAVLLKFAEYIYAYILSLILKWRYMCIYSEQSRNVSNVMPEFSMNGLPYALEAPNWLE